MHWHWFSQSFRKPGNPMSAWSEKRYQKWNRVSEFARNLPGNIIVGIIPATMLKPWFQADSHRVENSCWHWIQFLCNATSKKARGCHIPRNPWLQAGKIANNAFNGRIMNFNAIQSPESIMVVIFFFSVLESIRNWPYATPTYIRVYNALAYSRSMGIRKSSEIGCTGLFR